ncbi:MAG: phosphoethanolamine transferase domain-containing protein, partial [Pseudomonadota bacterium]|nr:phosphoethanolamine transferase domain-containing protein [Pseudomonadota bacterium]
MRFLLRPANLYLLLTYLALSAVPFVPMLLGKPLDRPWQVLGVEFVGWVAAWAVFKRPAWFHWLLIPAFLALPTEVYLFTYYGQGISTHHLGIIAETSPKEALEFLGQKVWLMLAVMAGVVGWWVTSFRAARRTHDLDWSDPSRWVTLVALAIGAAIWGYGVEFGIAAKPAVVASASVAKPAAIHLVKAGGPAPAKASEEEDEDDEEEEASAVAPAPAAAHTGWKLRPLPRWAALPFEFDAFAQSWPFGLVARGVDFYKERTYLAELGLRSASFHFGAHQQAADTEPETVVLVIGESSRFDRWSLNGYARDTNPLLR